jgi:hypothetical protein
VVTGLVVILILYLISLIVVAQDNLSADQRLFKDSKKEVFVFKGVTDCRQLFNRSYSTLLPNRPYYAKLPFSMNRYGGNCFSYMFWMKITNVEESNLRDKVIFMRGDENKYPLQKIDQTDNNRPVTPVGYQTRIIKMPLLKFGKNYQQIIVECNTTNDIEQTFDTTEFQKGETQSQREVLSMIPGRWILYTMTFEDNMPVDDFEDGIEMKMYINNVLLFRKIAKGALRLNEGDLHFFPKGDELIQGAFIGDFRYIPWAASYNEINKIYEKGVNPSKPATFCDASKNGGEGGILRVPEDDEN